MGCAAAVAGVLGAAAAPGAGAAAAPVVPGAECLSIGDEARRLACFDRAIGEAAHAAESTAAPSTTAGTAPATSPAAGMPPTLGGTAPPAVPDGAVVPSLIDAAWGFLPDSKSAYVRLHQPNYLLMARYSTDPNKGPYEPLFEEFGEDGDFESVESKFQISIKGRLLASDDRRWGLWFAYTQQNQWQVYSPDISRPFRETNYMPELFGSFRPGIEFGGWRWNLLNFGFNHQSNGRADPISRSWDRLFVEAGIERGNLVLLGRAWQRVRLGDYEDDNPDITDYYGYTELNALYRRREQTFSLMARGNVSTGKGAAQFNWTTRPLLGPMRGYVQLFTGYGESMIDYDWAQTTIGVGVTLNERF